MKLFPDEIYVAVECGPHELTDSGIPEGVRLIDRVVWSPSNGRATLARHGNTEQHITPEIRSTRYRLLCRVCHLDVVLSQANLNTLAAGLAEAGISSVDLSHLSRVVATMGGSSSR